MIEASIDPQLLSPESYLRIQLRITQIRESTELFGRYVGDNQKEYSKYATRTHEDCQSFERSLLRTGNLPGSPVEQITDLVRLFKEMAVNIQKMTTINMISLTELLQGQQAAVQDGEVRKAFEDFSREMEQYRLHQQQTQQVRAVYRQKCMKLDKALAKCSMLNQPNQFYNPQVCDEVGRDTELKFKSAYTKEEALLKELDISANRRRRLQQYVHGLKNHVIAGVKLHIGRICEMINIVLDSSHWEKEFCNATKKGNDMQSHYSQEMERLGTLYQLSNSRTFIGMDPNIKAISPLQRTSIRDISTNDIHQDSRLFLERCTGFIKTKTDELSQSILLKKQLRYFLEMKVKFMRELREGMDFVNQRLFGPGQKDMYRNTLVEYFGTKLASAFEIVQQIISTPIDIVGRIEQTITERLGSLAQLIQMEEQQLEGFQRDTTAMFVEHRNLRAKVLAMSMVPGEVHQQFVSNIKVTYLSLRATFNNLNEKQLQLSRHLSQQIKHITGCIQRECFLRSLAIKKEMEQGVYHTFRQINVDSEVLRIMDKDPTYQVLFHEFYIAEVPPHPQLKSSIDLKKYQQIKRLLEQKEVVILNDRNRPFLTSTCCMRTALLKNYPGTTIYKCCIYEHGQLNSGKLITLLQGIHWIGKRKSFFSKKVKLVVPRSDIRSFELKDINQSIKDCVVVHTRRGELTFTNFQNRDQAYVLLTKLFPQGQARRDGVDTDSRSSAVINESKIIDKSMLMNTSKILIRKNPSTFSMSASPTPQNPLTQGPLVERFPDQQDQDLLGETLERWLGIPSFFRQQFMVIDRNAGEDWLKCTYQTLFCGVYTHIRELKEWQLSDTALLWNYTWKVSFPQVHNIKSFVVQQYVKVYLENSIVKIDMLIRKPPDNGSYMQDIFYDQLKGANVSLVNFIMQVTDRECLLEQANEISTSSRANTPRQGSSPAIDELVLQRKSQTSNVPPAFASKISNDPRQSIVKSGLRGHQAMMKTSNLFSNGSPIKNPAYTSQLKNSVIINSNLKIPQPIESEYEAATPYFSQVKSETVIPAPSTTTADTPSLPNREGTLQEVFAIFTAYLLLILALYVF